MTALDFVTNIPRNKFFLPIPNGSLRLMTANLKATQNTAVDVVLIDTNSRDHVQSMLERYDHNSRLVSHLLN